MSDRAEALANHVELLMKELEAAKKREAQLIALCFCTGHELEDLMAMCAGATPTPERWKRVEAEVLRYARELIKEGKGQPLHVVIENALASERREAGEIRTNLETPKARTVPTSKTQGELRLRVTPQEPQAGGET